jgi:hypothetical protein
MRPHENSESSGRLCGYLLVCARALDFPTCQCRGSVFVISTCPDHGVLSVAACHVLNCITRRVMLCHAPAPHCATQSQCDINRRGTAVFLAGAFGPAPLQHRYRLPIGLLKAQSSAKCARTLGSKLPKAPARGPKPRTPPENAF